MLRPADTPYPDYADYRFGLEQDADTSAVQLDPTNAGRYYFNMGAVLTNNQQLDAAGRKKMQARLATLLQLCVEP